MLETKDNHMQVYAGYLDNLVLYILLSYYYIHPFQNVEINQCNLNQQVKVEYFNAVLTTPIS